MPTNTTLGRLRLQSQRVVGPTFSDPAEVVRCLGAIQAQDYHQALWAVGVRTQGATVADVEQALTEGRIVRTWPMRGTLHFVSPEDARWMLALSAPRILARDRRRIEELELDEAILARCEALVREALAGGQRRTRAGMMRLFDDAGVSTANQRGYRILWYLAQTGVICLGPMDGRTQTFVLLDEWAPNARDLPHDAALAELAGRFFTSHGPATVHDFSWWAGLTMADARAGLAAAQPGLTSIDLDGTTYWLAADTPSQVADDPAGVTLLAGFDEFLLGYRDRSAVLPAEHAQRVTPGGIFQPIAVADAQVVGTWRRTLKRDRVEVTVAPFVPGDGTRAWDVAAERYGAFLGLPATMRAEPAA